MLKRGKIRVKFSVFILFMFIIGMILVIGQGQLGLPEVCGNNICEEGEANDPGGCGPGSDPRCLGPPARMGTCPQDCEKMECETNTDCPQISCITTPCPQYSCINGECVLPKCGNGICEESEKQCGMMCPSCAPGTPLEECQCKEECIYTCPQDCQSVCTDSDGGNDYNAKGKTCIGSECKEDICLINYYLSYNLAELSCSQTGEIVSTLYNCPNGCKDGVCISCPLPPPCPVPVLETVPRPPDKCPIYTCPTKPQCSALDSTECIKYENCQVASSRKGREKCVDKRITPPPPPPVAPVPKLCSQYTAEECVQQEGCQVAIARKGAKKKCVDNPVPVTPTPIPPPAGK